MFKLSLALLVVTAASSNGSLDFSNLTLKAFDYIRAIPLISTLLILMLLDVLSGLMTSFIDKTLSSSISFRGMSRKVIILMVLGLAAVLEPFAQGIPLARLVAVFYITTEALSILENAAICGVPLPNMLTDTLAKLRESQRSRRAKNTQINLPPVEDNGVTRQISITEKPPRD